MERKPQTTTALAATGTGAGSMVAIVLTEIFHLDMSATGAVALGGILSIVLAVVGGWLAPSTVLKNRYQEYVANSILGENQIIDGDTIAYDNTDATDETYAEQGDTASSETYSPQTYESTGETVIVAQNGSQPVSGTEYQSLDVTSSDLQGNFANNGGIDPGVASPVKAPSNSEVGPIPDATTTTEADQLITASGYRVLDNKYAAKHA